MALELHIITSREFIRLGAHGELDWTKSLAVLSALAKSFVERGTNLAIVDLRDVRTVLSLDQVKALVHMLSHVGLNEMHRVAILHKRDVSPPAALFAHGAQEHGFDVEEFNSFEKAVEWLSNPERDDPDFDREIYHGPAGDSAEDGGWESEDGR